MSGNLNLETIKSLSSYLDKLGIDKSKLIDTKGNYTSLVDIYREVDNKNASDIVDGFCDIYQDKFSVLSNDEFSEFQNIMEDALNSYSANGSGFDDMVLNDFAQTVANIENEDPDTLSPSSPDSSPVSEPPSSQKSAAQVPLVEVGSPKVRNTLNSSQTPNNDNSASDTGNNDANDISNTAENGGVNPPSNSKQTDDPSNTTAADDTQDNVKSQLTDKDYKSIYDHSADVVDNFKDLSDSDKANAAKRLSGILFNGAAEKYITKMSSADDTLKAIQYYNKNVKADAKGEPGPLFIVFSYDDSSLKSYVNFFKENKDNYEVINLLIDEIKTALKYGDDKAEANRAMEFLNKIASDKELSAIVDKKLTANSGKSLSERISSRKNKIDELPAAEVEETKDGEKGEKSKNYNFSHSKISSKNKVRDILNDKSSSDLEKYKKIAEICKADSKDNFDYSYCYEILNSDDMDLAEELMNVLIAGANDNKKNKMLKSIIKHYGRDDTKIDQNEFFTKYLNYENYYNVYNALFAITENHTDALDYMGALANNCINTYGIENSNPNDESGEAGADKILANPSNVLELSKYGSSYVVRCMQNITMEYTKGGEVTKDKNNIAKIFESNKSGINSHAACSVIAQSIADCIKNGTEEDKEMAIDLAVDLLFHSMLGCGNTYEDMLCAIISVCDKDMFDKLSAKYALKYGNEYSGKKLKKRLDEETSRELQDLIDDRCK